MEEYEEKKENRFLREIWEWGKAIIIALVATLLLTQLVFVNAKVPTESMCNTILAGDRLLGLRFSYWFSSPERGDIIIFKFPDDEDVLYVKRVIGLPGETVEIRDGKVYINGSAEPLDEPYLREAPNAAEMLANNTYHVPEGCYFMMGDNRNNSWDSRYWENTYLKEEKIIGKAWLRLFPNPGILQ